MNTHIKTVGISLTPAISDYMEKRLVKIDQFLENDSTTKCDVELGKTTGHHHKGEIFRAEIHIVGRGKNVFARVERADLYAAIDEVTEDVFNSLTSRRKKYISMARRGGARVKNMLKGLWPMKGKNNIEMF